MITTTLMLVVLTPFAGPEKLPRTAIESSITLKVSDRNKTADTLISMTEELDGYFLSRTDNEVVLKVPVEHADRFIRQIPPMGVVVEKSFRARDVGATLRELRTRLKSRQQVFQRYFAVLGTASQNAVIQVESEMTQIVQEIETIKGSIRLIQHQLEFAQVVVRFQFRERRPPTRDGSSSFDWLNTMNIADLFAEFSYVD